MIGVDIDEAALDEMKNLGAELTFNSLKTKDFASQIKALTGSGVHAAAVYSASIKAYDAAVDILRLNGILMAVGLPLDPFPVNLTHLCTRRYRVRGESTSTPQRMKKAIDFIAKHGL